jgi:ubiquitin-like protein Pup
MAEQERRQREAESTDEAVVEEVGAAQGATERGERLKGELDDLLDEIDEVLETNAEEFVKSYIQKGGE